MFVQGYQGDIRPPKILFLVYYTVMTLKWVCLQGSLSHWIMTWMERRPQKLAPCFSLALCPAQGMKWKASPDTSARN